MNKLKYSLSSRQEATYLKLADEIRVQYRDRRIIPELVEKYSQARINLEFPYVFDEETPIDWNEIHNYYVLSRTNFIVGVVSTEQIKHCKEKGYPMYHRTHVHSFQELRDMVNAGMSEVYLGAPVFFCMDSVKRNFPGIKVRAVANVALPEGSLSYNDGTCGTWIRPEDVYLYEPYVDTIDFYGNQKEEQALYRIYARMHEWSRELRWLVADLNHDAMNRMIPPTLAETRLNCGQRCMENDHCHICRRLLDLANPDLIREVLEAQEQS